MPREPSRAFLLWHEAAQTGDWQRLLSRQATRDVMLALWMLQSFPAYQEGIDLPDEDFGELPDVQEHEDGSITVTAEGLDKVTAEWFKKWGGAAAGMEAEMALHQKRDEEWLAAQGAK